MAEAIEHIKELVARMTVKEQYHNSNDSISFKAYREAESIRDTSYISPLKNAIDIEKGTEKRDALYFILGKVGKNLSSGDIASYLIRRLKYETNKYILMAMLDRIAEIPKDDSVDISPLLELSDDQRWQVRHTAIQSLNKPNDKNAEDKLIKIVSNDEDPYNITYANSVLYQVGTPRAITALEKHIKSRKRDVKLSAISAIKAIEERNGLP
jgi:hypothetical protein